jgi:hypothetical protein
MKTTNNEDSIMKLSDFLIILGAIIVLGIVVNVALTTVKTKTAIPTQPQASQLSQADFQAQLTNLTKRIERLEQVTGLAQPHLLVTPLEKSSTPAVKRK